MGVSSREVFLPAVYTQRSEPEYFADVATDGVVWQPDVYPEAASLVARSGGNVVIDLGCGRPGKLVALRDQNPNLELVGVDFGPNITWCQTALPDAGTWLEADLETTGTLPLSSETIRRSVVVCSDVLEHLVDPRPAMQLICWLLAEGAAYAVLSTPARDLRSGAQHLGPPTNRSHVREWTREEFHRFVASFPVVIERFELTRSDDSGGGLTTQLAVVRSPEAG